MPVKLIHLPLIYGDAGAREKFEELTSHLIRSERPDAERIRVVRGDGGIDAHDGSLSDSSGVHVYQMKFFPDGIGDSQKAQVRDSFHRARNNRSELVRRYPGAKMRLTPAQGAVHLICGRAVPRSGASSLPERVALGRRLLTEITQVDFGYDLQRWHDHLKESREGGYTWNRSVALPKIMKEALASPDWQITVATLQAKANARASPSR